VSHKQELLSRAAEEYRAFYDALDGLNEDQLSEVWLGTWSVRDIVAHIVGWQRELGPALERLARGERPIPPGVSYEDVDGWNAKFAAAWRDARPADVLLELDRSHEAFLKAAAAVPEDRYQPDKTAYRMVDLNTAHHYRDHGSQIREWRATRGI
jgi:hypothetical protein